jgi:hypothetical protein
MVRGVPSLVGAAIVVIGAHGDAAAEPDGGADEPPPRVTLERGSLANTLPAAQDAQGRPLTDVAGVSLRWWTRHGRADLGVGVGTLGLVDQRPDPQGLAHPMLRSTVPTLTVGWRYRMSGEAALYADATSARSLAADAMPDLYATKVGMEWKPAKSRFGFENRSLGIQMQSGYRMSLRARKGGLGVYFRGNF